MDKERRRRRNEIILYINTVGKENVFFCFLKKNLRTTDTDKIISCYTRRFDPRAKNNQSLL